MIKYSCLIEPEMAMSSYHNRATYVRCSMLNSHFLRGAKVVVVVLIVVWGSCSIRESVVEVLLLLLPVDLPFYRQVLELQRGGMEILVGCHFDHMILLAGLSRFVRVYRDGLQVLKYIVCTISLARCKRQFLPFFIFFLTVLLIIKDNLCFFYFFLTILLICCKEWLLFFLSF